MSDLPFGGTDCALPMLYAQAREREIDTFVIYTDSETWAGDVHPAQALRDYRQASGIDARLVVVGMVSNGFSIADPNDPGMLDVVGFDTATPQLISDFASRRPLSGGRRGRPSTQREEARCICIWSGSRRVRTQSPRPAKVVQLEARRKARLEQRRLERPRPDAA